jgi:broad specificity phosphatase PhoE
MGLAPVLRPNLAEWDFGDAEGFSVEVLATQFPEIAVRFADIEDFEVGWPGGEPGGETRRAFHDRVYTEFMAILSAYERHSLIVVAHGGVFGSLLSQIQGNHPNDWAQYGIHNCSVTHLEVTLDDTAIHLMNDIEHLNGLTDPLEGLQSE